MRSEESSTVAFPRRAQMGHVRLSTLWEPLVVPLGDEYGAKFLSSA
jgi:hypothetical protein